MSGVKAKRVSAEDDPTRLVGSKHMYLILRMRLLSCSSPINSFFSWFSLQLAVRQNYDDIVCERNSFKSFSTHLHVFGYVSLVSPIVPRVDDCRHIGPLSISTRFTLAIALWFSVAYAHVIFWLCVSRLSHCAPG